MTRAPFVVRLWYRSAVFAALVLAAAMAACLYWIGPGTVGASMPGNGPDWPDRRPIASLMLCRPAMYWSGNPRGWFGDEKLDVRSPAGVANFQKRLLAAADQSVAIMRNVGAQGMVSWDLEGAEFPHKTSYIGDPRLIEVLAPETAGVLDLYFRKFRDAGFRTGLTIRPQELEIPLDRSGVRQRSVADPAAVLIAKIRYARNRWGVTLFYIDSNQTFHVPMRTAVLARVFREVPGILLIPEHSTPFEYAFAAPYSELRKSLPFTPDIFRGLYPHAFTVVNTADGKVGRRGDELEQAIRNGDILMFRGWFNDPANPVIREIYNRAKPRP